jgi:hypothetical protein
MPYGGVKFDTITFTNAGADTTTTISGLYAANLALSTGLTVTGTISGITVQGTTGVFGSGTVSAPGITIVSDLNTGIYSPAADTIAFVEGGAEAMRIDSSGRLLVGTSTSANAAASCKFLTNANSTEIRLDNAYASCAIDIVRQEALTGGGGIGTINWKAYDSGTTERVAGRITAQSDGNWSSGSAPGLITISTTASGATSPTERLRIDSSGRLSIGISTTQSDNSLLNIACPGPTSGDGVTGGAIATATNSFRTFEWGIRVDGVGFKSGINFRLDPGTGGSDSSITFITSRHGIERLERMRIDSSGRLLVGTSTARSTFFNQTLAPRYQQEGVDLGGSMLSVTANGTYGPSYIIASRTRATSVGGTTAVVADDFLGVLSFQGSDGTDQVEAAQIYSQVDGTPGANDMPGRLVFSTTADNAASPTERMRIDNAGRVLVGTATANTSGAKLQTSDGITFPATAVASADPNTLDDYEEGTWTPTVIGSSTAGTASYTSQSARYTKTGRMVQIELYVFWSGGTGTGNLLISGLPFSAANSSTFPALSVAGADSLALTLNNYANAYITNNASTITIVQIPVGGGSRTVVPYDAAAELLIAGCYTV